MKKCAVEKGVAGESIGRGSGERRAKRAGREESARPVEERVHSARSTTDQEDSADGKRAASATAPAISAGDLAELLEAVNLATGRLESSHAQLQERVGRLTADLSQANARLERSKRLAALGEMAAGIAHEVRNPLGSILLYARMLEEDLVTIAPASARTAGKIIAAGRIMNSIIHDVLSFAGELRLRPAPIDVAGLIESAIELCCQHRPWVPRIVLDLNAGVIIRGDEGMLRQAIMNVMSNAMEAMEGVGVDWGEGGHELRLSLDTGWQEANVDDGWVRVRVRDTGPGVTAKVSERMFNPFFTTRGTGTGLGLSIVHRIVDAHGGRVTVSNNKTEPSGGRGACISMILPRECIVSVGGDSIFGTFAEATL